MEPADGEPPFVSVIIPVFNDTARLRGCLDALARQTYPRARHEVVVVDNGSSDDVRAALGQVEGAIFAVERRPGSYAARNAGIAVARGEVLAFTDSDCLPQPDWIERGVARLLADPACGLVAGGITLFSHDPARPTAAELYERVTAFPQQKYVEKYHYGATANLFARRAVFARVGPFDAALASGGDREWGQRVHAAGLPLVYADEARVLHPARRTFAELSRKVARVTGGIEQLRARRPGSLRPFAKALLRDLLPPLGKIRGVWRDPRLAGAGQRLRVTGVLLALRYAQAWARLRARLRRPGGAQPGGGVGAAGPRRTARSEGQSPSAPPTGRPGAQPLQKNQLTILHLCDSLSVGGAERLILGLAGHLDRQRFAVRVCALGELRGNLLRPELERHGVPVQVLGARRFYDPAALAAVVRTVRAHDVDLIHTHLTSADVLGRLAGLLTGRPVVSTLHNEPRDYRRQRPDRRLLQRLTAPLAARLVAVSPRLRRMYLDEWRLPPERIVAITNGVPLDQFLAVPERRAAPDADLAITAIGRLSPQKDHATLLEAARLLIGRHPRAHITVVGQGRLEAELKRRAADLGIAEHVTFAGVQRDVPAVLAATDIFVLSSRWEGLPVTAVEAMAAGRAVVLTDVGGCRDLVEHGVHGLLVPPGSPQALADALAALAADPARRLALGRAARERAVRELGMPTFARRHAALYESVLVGTAGRPSSAAPTARGPHLPLQGGSEGIRPSERTLAPTPTPSRSGVAMISSVFHPSIGGAQRVILETGRRLRARGVPVLVVTRHHRGLPRYEEVAGIPTYRVGFGGAPKAVAALSFILGALLLLWRLRASYGLLHCHQMISPMTVGLLARALVRRPLVVMPHRSGPLGDIGVLTRRRPLTGRPRLAAARRWADAFICISPAVCAELLALGVPPARLWPIANGVDTARFLPASAAERRELRSANGLRAGPLVAFAGRLAPEKGLDVLLAAWPAVLARVPAARLLLVGAGDQRRSLEDQARALGVAASVTFAGGRDDVAPLLRAADLFVLPSFAEGLPVALLEAMACGLPCVATDIDGAAQVLRDGATGRLVPPGDQAALAAALVEGLTSDQATAWGQRGRALVAHQYALDAVVGQYLALYHALSPSFAAAPPAVASREP